MIGGLWSIIEHSLLHWSSRTCASVVGALNHHIGKTQWVDTEAGQLLYTRSVIPGAYGSQDPEFDKDVEIKW